mmetsp:Transcript_38668/g.74148  ORF Transcript_38668/g.74148 Transcript_38668/m.74148 type:complete len:245 (-) Transcript_38668:1918-2652(-)
MLASGWHCPPAPSSACGLSPSPKALTSESTLSMDSHRRRSAIRGAPPDELSGRGSGDSTGDSGSEGGPAAPGRARLPGALPSRALPSASTPDALSQRLSRNPTPAPISGTGTTDLPFIAASAPGPPSKEAPRRSPSGIIPPSGRPPILLWNHFSPFRAMCCLLASLFRGPLPSLDTLPETEEPEESQMEQLASDASGLALMMAARFAGAMDEEGGGSAAARLSDCKGTHSFTRSYVASPCTWSI